MLAIIMSDSAAAFAGYLQLKRKLFWVVRFVRVENAMLSYSEDKAARTVKFVASLHNAQFQERHSQEGVTTIMLQTTAGEVSFSFTKKEQKKHGAFVDALNASINAKDKPAPKSEYKEERIDPEPAFFFN
jgi:hypothetical protein